MEKFREIYSREPIGFHKDIPMFSAKDKYVLNYEKISLVHLDAMIKGVANPFIKDDIWNGMENNTVGLIKKHSMDGYKILDAGVGLGRVLENFTNMDRYGIDISLPYLEHAKLKGIDVCFALIEEMPYKKEFFDVITCTDVLEHVIDLNLAIERILAVLKPNGKLILRVPYKEDLENYLREDYPYPYVHLRNFDENSLKLLFTKVFKCTHVENQYFTYPHENSFKSKIPIGKSLIIRTLMLSKKLNHFVYDGILNILFKPLEISQVYIKK